MQRRRPRPHRECGRAQRAGDVRQGRVDIHHKQAGYRLAGTSCGGLAVFTRRDGSIAIPVRPNPGKSHQDQAFLIEICHRKWNEARDVPIPRSEAEDRVSVRRNPMIYGSFRHETLGEDPCPATPGRQECHSVERRLADFHSRIFSSARRPLPAKFTRMLKTRADSFPSA